MKYEELVIEIIFFKKQDIIITSEHGDPETPEY